MVSNANVKHYFFDYETGMSRDNCHPRFAQLAPDDFFYDECDDFSPFGSDCGHDTLFALQTWYQEDGRRSDITAFMRQMLAGWDCPVPKNILQAEPARIEKWLAADDLHDRFLIDECRARVATAFGQLRITGAIKASMVDEGLLGLRRQSWLNERARAACPDWQYAGLERQRLHAMHAVLEQLRSG